VCRDLLNPAAVHALAEAGVNLVLAPAMTEAIVPFGGPVAQLVGAGQALVVVANNPCRWVTVDGPGGPSPARALFGHPGFSQQTRQVHAGDDEPGVALLHVRSGRLRWHSRHDPAGSGSADDDGAAPPWAREEIGLDPRSVHIIGTLPAMGLPASGFLVTPVLAWSSDLRFVHGTNPAEVSEVHRVPLTRWRRRDEEPDRPHASVGAMTAMVLDVVAALIGTASGPMATS